MQVTKKNKNQPEEPTQDQAPLDGEIAVDMEELKRDMRSAKMADWLQKNQQQLIAGAVIVLMALVAGGLWSEHKQSQKESAAAMYYQALSEVDADKRQALLEAVVQGYQGTGYAVLSHVRLATMSEPEKHLKAVMNDSHATEELRWQAALDLAEYWINNEKSEDAKALLNKPVGKQFEQLRFYLLAEISSGEEKQGYLQKALDAISNDDVLKTDIEAQLAKVGA